MPIKQVARAGLKKQELLARKETILNNIRHYEKRIREESAANASAVIFDDSSDSEDELLPFHLNDGPTIGELQREEKMLQVGLNATCELACLEVLQSEVNVMLEDPVITMEKPVSKPGLWREVTAECRVGLVPFSIMFYVHQATGQFGAKSYRGLQVLAVKKSHEVELSKSVLPRVKCPSNAVEVLRSYAAAHRSRRTTLARLADKYAHTLFMEPMLEGGYRLKCADLLELSWVLENKKSPLSPFHHRMNFVLEYMDESNVKIIRQAHKQLSDPSIDTDERTLLLVKIINTCLEVESRAQESMESDKESVRQVEKRRITLEMDAPVAKKTKNNNDENDENNYAGGEQNNHRDETNDRDNETNDRSDDQIMAPPKSLPKKVKPKGKENMDQNKKAVKRSAVEERNSSVKKGKVDKSKASDVIQSLNEHSEVIKDTENNNDDADSVRSKNKSTKTQIVKKASDVQNNVNKEANKGSDKVKVLKSKATEVKDVTESGNKLKDNDNINKKGTDKLMQEKPEKQTIKNKDSQKGKNKISPKTMNINNEKVASKEKADDTKKDDPKTKPVNEAKKVACKPVGSKNNAKNKESNKNEIPSSGKSNQKVVDSDNTERKKDPKNDQPISENVDKVVSSKNDIKVSDLDENQEGNKAKTSSKNGHTIENVAKHGNNTEKVTSKKISSKSTAPKVHENNKENIVKSNRKDIKETIVSKQKSNEAAKKTDKVKNGEESTKIIRRTISKEDQNEKETEISANKKLVTNTENAEPRNTKLVNSNIKNPENGLSGEAKITESQKLPKYCQKSNAQHSKPTVQKKSEKNRPFNSDKIIASTPKMAKNTENNRESIAKTSNVASKNREHIANIAITKNTTAKIGNGKPSKMVIKNISHRNPTKHKLPKIIAGNIKSVKPGNIGNVFKTDNISKDSNGSRISKIPKKLSIPEDMKGNPLRMSPRRLPSCFKSTLDSGVKQKLTNIPRLMKKI